MSNKSVDNTLKSYLLPPISYLSAIAILSLISYFIPATALASAPTSGLVGYWNMDEGTGTTANDSSGNGNNGMLVNGPVWVVGKVGSGALSFDGSNDYVTTSDISVMDSQSAFTVSAWVKLNSTAINQTVSGKWDGSAGLFFQTGNACGGGDDISFGFSGGYVCTNANLLKAGQWQHWAGVFDNSLGANKHRIYLNGVQQSTTNFGSPDIITSTGASTANFEIGDNNALNRFLNGSLDDVRVCNRALSAQEIQKLYQLGR